MYCLFEQLNQRNKIVGAAQGAQGRAFAEAAFSAKVILVMKMYNLYLERTISNFQ